MNLLNIITEHTSAVVGMYFLYKAYSVNRGEIATETELILMNTKFYSCLILAAVLITS